MILSWGFTKLETICKKLDMRTWVKIGLFTVDWNISNQEYTNYTVNFFERVLRRYKGEFEYISVRAIL